MGEGGGRAGTFGIEAGAGPEAEYQHARVTEVRDGDPAGVGTRLPAPEQPGQRLAGRIGRDRLPIKDADGDRVGAAVQRRAARRVNLHSRTLPCGPASPGVG